MDLLGEYELQRIARTVMVAADADQVEVAIESGTSALTRFANNYIHQNVQETDTSIRVRAVIGKRIGVAETDVLTDDGLRGVAQRAVALARLAQPNDDFVGLPAPVAKPLRVDALNPRTAAFSAEERATVVRQLCEAAVAAKLVAAGAFETGVSERAVANSLGVWAYHRVATADASTVIMGETSSGHAERLTLDAGEIDGAALASEAIDKARRGADPRPLDPGVYDVILEEYAVSDFLDLFSDLSFGAQPYVEQRSFMAGRIGERVMGENISIWDDALSLDNVPDPFDAEGMPRQRVPLVENGIAQGVVWDSYYGAQHGQPSTGHALPAGYASGPMPSNLFLGTGDSTKEEMIANTERGIWVSRFWYTRPVHPLAVVMTGMTRDGTFLIENGKIVAPVKNLRFTHGYVEALNNVERIGREAKLLRTFGTTVRVPALQIRGWNFTGSTE